MTRNTLLAVLFAVVVATSALAVPAVASDSSISADPDGANAQSTHTVRAEVGTSINDSSLTGIDVDYSATSQNGDVEDVGESDIEELYVERADGSRTDVSDDVSTVGASNNGETLNIRLEGNYDVFTGDHVVVSYSGVTNPDAGEYGIVFTLNPQSDGTQSSDTLPIPENTSSTPTPTDGTPTDDESTPPPTGTPTPTETATPAETATSTAADDTPADDGTSTVTRTYEAGGDESDDDGGSGGDGAGFGVALAAVALLGAVLLARR